MKNKQEEAISQDYSEGEESTHILSSNSVEKSDTVFNRHAKML